MLFRSNAGQLRHTGTFLATPCIDQFMADRPNSIPFQRTSVPLGKENEFFINTPRQPQNAEITAVLPDRPAAGFARNGRSQANEGCHKRKPANASDRTFARAPTSGHIRQGSAATPSIGPAACDPSRTLPPPTMRHPCQFSTLNLLNPARSCSMRPLFLLSAFAQFDGAGSCRECQT